MAVDRSREGADLVEQAKAGSTEAFTQLVRLHQAAVRGYVARYVPGRATVDDLAQEVFLAAYRGLGTYRGESPIRLWLLAIARRHIADHLRQAMRRRAHESLDLEAAILRWQAETIDEAAEYSQDAKLAALTACLGCLPAASRDLIEAFYFRAQSAASIAQRIGKREGAVRMTLLRLRESLRDCVRERLAPERA